MSSRLEALDDLMQSIHRTVDAGHSVPCTNPETGHWWLAEDRELVEAAKLACSTCPVLGMCRRYVEAHPEPAGVWAGRVGHLPRYKREAS